MNEADRKALAQDIVDAQGPLNGVTPENARQRLDDLIRFDREWAGRVFAGDSRANAEFNRLTDMIHNREQAQAKAEFEAATNQWNSEQAAREAAKQQEDAKVRAELEDQMRAWAAQNPQA